MDRTRFHNSQIPTNGNGLHAANGDGRVRAVADLELPTPFGIFHAHAFECPGGHVYLALVAGDIAGDEPVLARIHSECLTGDALGSLRCDCGVQLRTALRTIAAESRGVLVYATGHEGRGIGLVNKLRAYVEQDLGSDTVDANLHLGLPVDERSYVDAAHVLRALGVARVRLITNNPEKVRGLEAAGIQVSEMRNIPIAAHSRNLKYLRTKQSRMGHLTSIGSSNGQIDAAPPDVSELIGDVEPGAARPYLVLKYAQSVDGRIATSTGDARWISGQEERRVSHAIRAGCDAIMVGAGTVIADDPQLTVRMVPGASPIRIVLDSRLKLKLDAKVLDESAATIVMTTTDSDPEKRSRLSDRGIRVVVVEKGPEGVDMDAALRHLSDIGIRSLLVEGGGRVITSLLEGDHVDRLIVSVAPLVLGRGIEGVGDLGILKVADGVVLERRAIQLAGDDVLLAWDVCEARRETAGRATTAEALSSST